MPPSPPPGRRPCKANKKKTSPTKVKTSGPLLPSCLSPNKDILNNDEKKPAALKPSPTEFDRIAAELDSGTGFLKNDFYDHFGDIASTTPQGNFDCYHHTPVVLVPEARQHLLESHIAENEMTDTVALLLQMFFEKAIFFQPDTHDGVSSTGRTSVGIRTNETAYTSMRALCPHGISPASDLPHLLDTPENRELRGFFFEFIEEFLGRYGLMIPGTTYNVRLQDMQEQNWIVMSTVFTMRCVRQVFIFGLC